MQGLLFIALLACTVAVSATSWNQLDNYSFTQYMREFKKTYSNLKEFSQRKKTFDERLTQIKAHNLDNTKSWKMGVNKYTDRTEQELNQVLGYDKSLGFYQHSKRQEQVPFEIRTDLPPTVDWRTKGVITPVKDQGGCGSCWTFGTVETIESFWALSGRTLPVLSEQQALDCTPNPDDCGGTGGCGGGTAEIIYQQLVASGGITSEQQYPYVGEDEQCQFNNKTTPIVAKISGYVALPSNQYQPVMNAVATVGPLVINVDASSWFGYDSGVFDGCDDQNPDIDHVVQLVGYGTDSDYGDYWLIRNSWGDGWGEEGYIRLKRNSSKTPCGTDLNPQDGTGCNGGPSTVTVCGECGMLYDVSYPTIPK